MICGVLPVNNRLTINEGKRMRIGIIGGGSIGLLFAYYLSQSFSVNLYTRTGNQAEKLNHDGVYLKEQEEMFRGRVVASPIEKWSGQEDFTIITVKQYQLNNVLARMSSPSVRKGPLLFLQNGMGHLDAISLLTNKEIYVGSVEHGALRINENTVSHNGVGVTKVASYRGDSECLRSFLSLSPRVFPFVYEENYYQMLIRKLLVNAMINPLTAILQVKNGQLVENSEYLHTLTQLFNELAEVLKLENRQDSWQHVLTVCRNTAQNQSSMLKDLLNHQKTEVDAILGYLLKEAEKTGCSTPLMRAFYHLIKGKEHEGRGWNNDV